MVFVEKGDKNVYLDDFQSFCQPNLLFDKGI